MQTIILKEKEYDKTSPACPAGDVFVEYRYLLWVGDHSAVTFQNDHSVGIADSLSAETDPNITKMTVLPLKFDLKWVMAGNHVG